MLKEKIIEYLLKTETVLCLHSSLYSMYKIYKIFNNKRETKETLFEMIMQHFAD